MKRSLELLAPARDADTAIAAIDHGADAVYIGAPAHGARASATNSIDDIARVCRYAHDFGARVYVTVNTIVTDEEVDDVCGMIRELYRVGVDALIVQDMSLLRMPLPPISLHASTQCDTRDADKARFLEQAGFAQIVLARELTLEEISVIHKAVDVPLEAFVHGALCVCYSGDCQMSFQATGRSANRGACAQMCRLSYDLVDGRGEIVMARRHLLSLRDMNRVENLGAMARAGVSSFKIEGRLKDTVYVKNVVAAYSRALDEFIAANSNDFCRSSQGRVTTTFVPYLHKSFNRGYTDYFLTETPGKGALANMLTPKDSGVEVAVVKGPRKGGIALRVAHGVTLHNGDGMCWFTPDGDFRGFRVNRVEGDIIYPAGKVDIPAGTTLRRNHDEEWESAMTRPTARRVIDCDVRLWLTADCRLALRFADDYGVSATVTTDDVVELPPARTPDVGARARIVGKLGDTHYELRDFDDRVPQDLFIPASMLTKLRRKAVEAFDSSRLLSRRPELRLPENKDAALPAANELTYHDNVANRLAREFYTDHGAAKIEPALEVRDKLPQGELRVMTCRYCLRRELGACLKEGGADRLPGPLWLTRGNRRWRLDFDCRNCRMQVIANPTENQTNI